MDRPAILLKLTAVAGPLLALVSLSPPLLLAQTPAASSGASTKPTITSVPAATTSRTLATTPSDRALADADAARDEDFALGIPSPENAKKWLRLMTDQPHVAGTKADHDSAIAVRDLLQSWGWAAQIVEYEVLLNYPRTGDAGPILELIRPDKRSLKVIEDPYPLDKDSANSTAFPAFHGYGVSGDVTGQVVYANYGRIEDFEALEQLGVSVKGKIVLVRYGEVFRGLKVRNAQKRGAIGILIYSDPMDDGFMKGDVYPHGPYRPASAIQRGSVQFLSLGPGDPSTPNTASVKGAKRLPVDERNGFTLLEAIDRPASVTTRPPFSLRDGRSPEAVTPGAKPLTIPEWEKQTGLKREDYYATIPSLPISYESAKPILEAMGGGAVPHGFQGGLPLAYHTGPGPAEVHFKIEMDYAVRPIWNVVATLKGSIEPERWVMVGNHRDAWVYGAADPSSGTAATLEMCRALGAAVKNGWKPRRTIVYASWDAEEYGLVGSTEWAEEHASEITEKAVMMLNVDVAVSGPEFDIDGVPSLRDFLLDAAAKVPDHRSGKSLKDVWIAKQRTRWATAGPLDFNDTLWTDGGTSKAQGDLNGFHPQLNPLGSGSDYTAFLDHLGVPAIDVSFSGRYGVYHAMYDNFFWMEKFGDPEFVYHATAARIYTLLAMRAASAPVVPLRFTPYAHAMKETVNEYRRTILRKSRGSEPGAVAFPFTYLSRLVGSVKEFRQRAVEADAAAVELSQVTNADPQRLAEFNDALMSVERAFLIREGLPGRPWFRHAVYAPGMTTGYAAWVFPGLRQGLMNNDTELFSQQVIALSQRIDAASETLRKATRIAKTADTKPLPAAAGPRIEQPKPEID